MVFPQTAPAPKGRTGGTLVQPRKKSTAIFGERGNGQALGILLRLAWNLFVFCDEYNFSPEAVCGSGLDLGLLWLRLLAALLLLLGGLGLLFRLPLVRVVMVLSVVNLGISLRLLGTLLLFCHRQGMAPALVCGSALHWGLLWVQLIAALALLLCSLGRQFPRRVSKASP